MKFSEAIPIYGNHISINSTLSNSCPQQSGQIFLSKQNTVILFIKFLHQQMINNLHSSE
jgi:hypothetical protein